jgi:Glyoxalase-like domain
MPVLTLDHLVVAASTLAEGRAWAKAVLRVEVPLGGQHRVMHTHNAVTALGGGTYLEIIAVDPERPVAERPRWFGLDDTAMRERLQATGPQLITWVASTPDLAGLVAHAAIGDGAVDLGQVLPMARGDLRWQIAVRPDGTMPESGLVPTCIEWPAGPHVSARMADFGVRLQQLAVHTPEPDRFSAILTQLGARGLVEVVPDDEPRLAATLRLPDGSLCRVGKQAGQRS